MQSLLYRHGTNYALTFKLAADPNATPQYDEWEDEILPASPPTGVTFEVQLEPSRGSEQARVGYDPSRVEVKGVVVNTPYNTLELPEGVGAGSTFPLAFRGKAGALTIGAAPSDQHPIEKRLEGERFYGSWRG